MSKCLLVLCLLLCFISKVFADEAAQSEKEPEKVHFVSEEGMEDPFEDWNRVSLKVNEGLDMLILLPIVDLYYSLTPSVVRDGVSNGLQNIATPFFVVNFLLQGEGEKAGRSLGRFIVNTIFGILGLFDVAEELGLPAEETTFGETIQRWGGQPGPYLVWPLFGPSCARDSFGLFFGFFLSPVDMWWLWKGKYDLVDAHVALVFLDTKMKYAATLENLRETSLDYYVVLRSLYGQKQSSFLKIADRSSQAPEDDGPRPVEIDDGPRPVEIDDGPRPVEIDDGPRPVVVSDRNEKGGTSQAQEDDGPRPLATL